MLVCLPHLRYLKVSDYASSPALHTLLNTLSLYELDLELHADHRGNEGCAPVVLFLMKSSQLKTLIISGPYALAYLFVGKQGVQVVASGVKVVDDS